MLGILSLLVLSYLATLSTVCEAEISQRYCAYSNPSGTVQQPLYIKEIDLRLPTFSSGDIVNNTIRCNAGMSHCFWLSYTEANKRQFLQGCWYPNPLEVNKCQASACVPKPLDTVDLASGEPNTYCCCRGDFCNGNDTASYSIPEIQGAQPQDAAEADKQLVVPESTSISRTEPPLYCAFIDISISMQNTGGQLSFIFNDEYSKEAMSDIGSGAIQPDNKTIKCSAGVSHCFSLWISKDDNQTFLKQGCWIPSNHDCNNSSCIATGHLGDLMPEGGRFCCCKGTYCNRNITNANWATPPPVIIKPSGIPLKYAADAIENERRRIIALAISPIIVVAVLVILVFLVYRMWARSRKEPPDSLHLMEGSTSSPPSHPTWELDALKLNTLINGGRYGEVWRGTLGDTEVAVKVFTGNNQKQYYMSEKDVYTLPHMETERWLPHFYGFEERLGGGSGDGTTPAPPQYLLVMEYLPMGTLTNHLKHNTCDWLAMCRMCRSVAGGLAHLHTEILKGDKFKPAVAHRDLNTRNILVRPDQTCVICDFGFAMQIIGSNYIKNGSQEVAEQSSLNDVGTIRYMPPEVLEGAVNLRDCEASLKQIDVYALGLIFWEIGSRCTDLYQGLPVPEYQLPFQAELGPHPTFEDMTLMVSKNKARPMFPDVWKDSNQGIRALKETIEDCWDQDGEARLTALCVDERMAEMEVLWTARQRGVTPKINTTNFQSTVPPIPEKTPQLCNTSLVNECQGLDALRVQEQNIKNLETTSPTIQLPAPTLPGGPGPIVNASQAGRHRMSLSENSVSTATTDTLLSPTTEMVRPPPNVSHPATTWNMYTGSRNNKMLPPHQGQNPTVERNTHKRSDEDLEILGNTLVNRVTGRGITDMSFGGAYPHSPSDSVLDNQHLGGDTLETSLVQNDVLNRGQGVEANTSHSRSSAPPTRNLPRIPYMQNDMVTEPLLVRPKQSNLQQECKLTTKQSEPRAFLGRILRHPKLHLPFFKKAGKQQPVVQPPLPATSNQRDSKNMSPRVVFSGGGATLSQATVADPSKIDAKNRPLSSFPNSHNKPAMRQSAGASNLETAANQIGGINPAHQNAAPVSTEVRLIDGGDRAAVVRAALGGGGGSSDDNPHHQYCSHGTSQNHGHNQQGRPGGEDSSTDSTELKRYVNSAAAAATNPTRADIKNKNTHNVVPDDSKTDTNINVNIYVPSIGRSSNKDNTNSSNNNHIKGPITKPPPRDSVVGAKAEVVAAKRQQAGGGGGGGAADLSPVMEARGVAGAEVQGGLLLPRPTPKRPSSLVIKSRHPRTQQQHNGPLLPPAQEDSGRSQGEGGGAGPVDYTSAAAIGNHHHNSVSSPDLSLSDVAFTAQGVVALRDGCRSNCGGVETSE